ncbi:hypothetical protein ACH4ZX_03755 [Streptomyces sp. NPDC020490]|uniref:hypothetical protein n=1 Tax=Streptomyces sp. NPDC020490 TaxID=3365078 RepID=UPI00378A1B87
MAEHEWHYVITLQYQNPNGPGIVASTRDGVVGFEPGDTREKVYAFIVKRTAEELGVESCVTLFFDLARNDLEGEQDG